MMDERTDHLDLPLPHPEHLMVDDVARLREALRTLDAAVAQRAQDSVEIVAGTGLTGGGNLQENRSLAVKFATQVESEAASSNTVVMSPVRTRQTIDARLASQETAEAGEDATLLMTPLRTKHVVDREFLARLASQGEAEAGQDVQQLMTPLRSLQALNAQLANRIATQEEAQAGVNASQLMTPLRVAQFLAAQPKGEIYRLVRTSNVKLIAADFGRFIDIPSGSFTQIFDAVATLGDGWFCYLQNSGTGDVTLDPSGSETIDGLTSFIMYPGETRLVLCDGTALRSVVLNAFYKAFTASGSFKKPPGYTGFEVEVIGGGAGGPGGKPAVINGTGAATRTGQAGGAPGRRPLPQFFVSGDLEDNSTVVVGAGGNGGASNANGGAGGASTFISTQVLSSGSAGIPEISGIRRCGTVGGKGGNTALNYNSATGNKGDNGSFNFTGITLPQGGNAANVGNSLQSGTYTATASNGQSSSVPFCSGAGGGSAGGGASTNLSGEQLVITLQGGNGGHGGLGAGGGAGGDAVVVWGYSNQISWSVYPSFTVTGGTGGNGGPGLVSIWGVI